MSSTAYPIPIPIAAVIDRLAQATATDQHESLPCSLSLLDRNRFNLNSIFTSTQVTDAYLLGLAVVHEQRLVTFDTRITLQAVRDATPEHLVDI
jgi:uncharacterized protein